MPGADSDVRELRRDWVREVGEFTERFRQLGALTELNYALIHVPQGGEPEWTLLSSPPPRKTPFDFERFFRKEGPLRSAHYRQAQRTVMAGNGAQILDSLGFHELFCSVSLSTDSLLYAGPFCLRPPEYRDICASWEQLSGRAPEPEDADFARFVEMVCALPVISEVAVRGLEQILTLYGRMLGREGSSAQLRQLAERLEHDVLTRFFPDKSWIPAAIGFDSLCLPPWRTERESSPELTAQWELHRFATNVLTLMPLRDSESVENRLQERVRYAGLQRECLTLAASMELTVATKLGDYGVMFATSIDSVEQPPAVLTEQLRQRGERIRDFIRERCGLETVIGVGRTTPPNTALLASYRDAILNMHVAVQTGQAVRLAEAENSFSDAAGMASTGGLLDSVLTAFDGDSPEELQGPLTAYVTAILRRAGEQVEVVRAEFGSLLVHLGHRLSRKNVAPDQMVRELVAETLTQLEGAVWIRDLVVELGRAVDRLRNYSALALEGPQSIRLNATLEYLQANFSDPLRLPVVARKAGFSVPTFTRVFKQATGSSFLTYVRALRVDHAKTLLSTSLLTTSQIARASGFQSSHHLIRSFKKLTGETPMQYRRRVARTEHVPQTLQEPGSAQ